MFEILVKYNVEYEETGFEILQPIILENHNNISYSASHDFYFLKSINANFLVNYKSINEKIMNALLDNKKVFVSKDINYHYVNDTDIQILETENKKQIEFGHYLYITKNLNNEYYIFYISDKKISSWSNENNLILDVSKDVYDTLLSLYQQYPYSYFIIKNILQQTITLEDIVIKHFYLSNDKLEEQTDILSNNLKINKDYTYLSEPTYIVIDHFMKKNLLTSKNIKRCPHYMDMISFITNNFYQINTLENIFDESIQFKIVLELIDLTGYERGTVVCVLKQDPVVAKIQLYNFIKKNKQSIYMLYAMNVHETQFLSYQYLNYCSIYNVKYIEKNIISNAILLDNSMNVIHETITLKNIDDIWTFVTMDDMLLYYNIDYDFLKLTKVNNQISVDIDIDSNNTNNTYVALLPYYGEKNLGVLKITTKEDVKKNNYNHICINDNSIIEYIKHIESKNLLPVISKEDNILKNISINHIMVITPELKTLEEKKHFILEKIKQNIYVKHNDINLFEFVCFVKMIEELSLYGIFINIIDSTDFNQIESDIKNLSLPQYKTNKLLNYFKIIKNDYRKYNKAQKDFIDFYFDVYMTLEQINNNDELVNFIKKTSNKYFNGDNHDYLNL